MKRFRWLILLVILAVFGLIMLTVPFHLASSKTGTSTQFSLASGNNPKAERVPDVSRVFLHVENRVGIGSTLAWALRRNLEDAGFTVVLLNNDPGPDDYPLLLAGIQDKHGWWKPLYAFGSMRIVSRYASYTTDIELDKSEIVRLDGTDDQSTLPIQMRMIATVSNRTIGLVSLPAHRRMLVDEPASDIAKYIKKGVDDALETASETSSNE
jgi:hypothetical protein